MWVEQLVRNATDEAAADSLVLDYVDVEWDRCGRTLKARSRAGEEVRVLLPLGQQLRHGDVLFEDAHRRLVVNVPPCPLIVSRPGNAREAAILALELGNLHWPTQVTVDEILFPEDGPPLEVVDRMGIPWTREGRRFEPTPVTSAPSVTLASGGITITSMSGRT